MKNNQYTVATLGAMLFGSLVSGSAVADSHPFGMQLLESGYSQFAGEGKCGEGKCGEGKKSAEGKCGEGKCGEGKKSAEGKCGEGKCGGKQHAEGKKKEGKCGEGKCGAA